MPNQYTRCQRVYKSKSWARAFGRQRAAARILPVRLVLGNNSSSAVSGTDAGDAGSSLDTDDTDRSLDTDRLPEYRN